MIKRYSDNPVITPEDVPPLHPNSKVIGAFNAGVAHYDGEYILLLRVAEQPMYGNDEVSTWVFNSEEKKMKMKTYKRNDSNLNFEDPRTIRANDHLEGFVDLTSISYLRLARSKDGYHFTVDDKPFIYPHSFLTEKGIEDARITQIGKDYYITYSQISKVGITVGMSKTRDFLSHEFLGTVLAPDNKDVVLFPKKINGKYYMLHRPCLDHSFGLNIWIASSEDLLHWGNHQLLLERGLSSFEEQRIGAGTPPIETKDGWLVLYHGVDRNSRYVTCGMILDYEDPSKILYKCDKAIFEPVEKYEKEGFFADVVFLTGHVEEEGFLQLYYGVSDTSVATATMKIEEVLRFIKMNSCQE